MSLSSINPPQQAGHDLCQELGPAAASVHRVVLHAPHSQAWSARMSSASARETHRVDRELFRKRQAQALARRLQYLPAKVVAHALGVHGDTVLAWSRGESIMDGAAIGAVDQFFAGRGDWGFIGEVYGDLRVRHERRAQQLEAEARRLRETAQMFDTDEVAA